MSAHPYPKRILIIGGGDGIVLREVLKYPSVEYVLMVEVESRVIDISRKYLRLDNGGFEDPRLQIIISDAATEIEKINEKFDVIIGDYSDPYQDLPAGSLVDDRFYSNIYRLLDDSGILSVQSGSPIFQRDIFINIYRLAKKHFPSVYVFWCPVVYYPGAVWTFIAATKGLDPRLPRTHIKGTTYYNKEIHRAAFILPEFIRNILRSEAWSSTEA